MNELVDQLLVINKEFNLTELGLGLKYFHARSVRKGEPLIKPGCKNAGLFFIADGIFESYAYNSHGKIEVYWFEGKNSFITDIEGFIQGKSSKTYIVACDDSMVGAISRKDVNDLCNRFRSWAIWRAKLLEYEYLKLFDFYRVFLHSSAEEKYEWLLKMYPDLLKKVPLGHVASLIGISQVSLSRIRAGKQTK